MACEYTSTSVFEQFTNRAALEKAFDRVGRRGFELAVTGLAVLADNQGRLNALKQAYQVEAARAALKKKGFFVTEKKAENGKITLTVRA
jgi:hypothetical protein